MSNLPFAELVSKVNEEADPTRLPSGDPLSNPAIAATTTPTSLNAAVPPLSAASAHPASPSSTMAAATNLAISAIAGATDPASSATAAATDPASLRPYYRSYL
jgi:hypothetical protein